jgi:hypothetical protein
MSKCLNQFGIYIAIIWIKWTIKAGIHINEPTQAKYWTLKSLQPTKYRAVSTVPTSFFKVVTVHPPSFEHCPHCLHCLHCFFIRSPVKFLFIFTCTWLYVLYFYFIPYIMFFSGDSGDCGDSHVFRGLWRPPLVFLKWWQWRQPRFTATAEDNASCEFTIKNYRYSGTVLTDTRVRDLKRM